MYVLGYPLLSAVTIIDALLLIYTFIIIAHAVLSWINPDPSNPLVRILANLTDILSYGSRVGPDAANVRSDLSGILPGRTDIRADLTSIGSDLTGV